MKKIEIVDHNPVWQEQFASLKEVFLQHLAAFIISVEHVGSTAVPRLHAKPILDIDLVVADENRLHEVIPILAKLGYAFSGDQGIKDRYAFAADAPYAPFTEERKIWPKHHLYCCIEGSISLKNHLILRDALINSPALAREYGILKRQLAQKYPFDIGAYVEGKTGFISKILLQGGLDQDSIEAIGQQNKKR
jgi:GrpB-like predicted nucleotidyltransferase (UPF0157 family)